MAIARMFVRSGLLTIALMSAGYSQSYLPPYATTFSIR